MAYLLFHKIITFLKSQYINIEVCGGDITGRDSRRRVLIGDFNIMK